MPGEDGDMQLYASTQHPSEIQHKVADMLGVASHAVTVETRRMGGAFGGKESQGNLPALTAALAAHLTGRPAKTVYDRDDDFMLTDDMNFGSIMTPGLMMMAGSSRCRFIRLCDAACHGICRSDCGARNVSC